MGLFDKLFGKNVQSQKIRNYFKMLDGYSPRYTTFNGGLYEMAQTKAVINTIASDCGKAIPELRMHNKRYEYILRKRPNPYMNASDFIERVVTNYLCDNNSFIVPIMDKFDRVNGLFPISYLSAEPLEYNGELYIEYTFFSNEKKAIEYSKIGHLKRMQRKNDLFGDSNNAMDDTLEMIHSQNQSVTEALKNSGVIRFMAKIRDQLINKEDFEEERELFSSINFSSNNRQMMIYDSRYEEIKQIDSKPITLDKEQQEAIDKNIYNYFGVSVKVVQHNFTDDEWNAYYEGVIEPILIKLGLELEKILYTEAQIMNGNEVIVSANRLQYMSNSSKLNFTTSMFDRGVINGDTVSDVWQLPHHEGGDKYYIRKEYAEVNKLDTTEPLDTDEDVVLNPIDSGGEENGNE